MFMQFQFVKDALNFMTTYKENNILFELYACILRSRNSNADPAQDNWFASENVFKQREPFLCLLSILLLDLKMLCLVSSKSIITYTYILIITNLFIIMDLKGSRKMYGAL